MFIYVHVLKSKLKYKFSINLVKFSRDDEMGKRNA